MSRVSIFILLLFLLSNRAIADDFDVDKVAYLVDTGAKVLESGESNQLSDYFIEKLKYYDVRLMQLRAKKDHKNNPTSSRLDELHVNLRALLSSVDENTKPFTLVSENLNNNDAGIIRGRVAGGPLNNSNYLLWLYRSDGSYHSISFSNYLGEYEFDNLSPGSYFVYLDSEYDFIGQFNGGIYCQGGLGIGCNLNELIPIVIDTPDGIQTVDFDVIEKAKITGKVKNNIGNYLGYGTAYLYNQDQIFIDSSYVSVLGEYTLVPPEPGNYYVALSAFDYVDELYSNQHCDDQGCPFDDAEQISVGLVGTTVLSDFEMEPYQDFTGTILDQQTLENIEEDTEIQIYDAENDTFVSAQHYDTGLPAGVIYNFTRIPPGQYHVKTRAENYLVQIYALKNCPNGNIDSCDFAQSNATVINHGSEVATNNINFRLSKGAEISGSIQDESESLIEGVSVTLYNQSGDSISEFYSHYGHFKFGGLGNGTYYISAHKSGFLNTLYPDIACSDFPSSLCSVANEGEQIQVSEFENKENVNVTLQSGSSMTGNISDTSGQGIENAFVYLFDAEGSSSYDISSAYTDAQGHYVLTGIPAGQYHLVAYANNYQPEIYNNIPCPRDYFGYDCSVQNAQVINVTEQSQNDNYHFSLNQLATLSVNLQTPLEQDVQGHIHIYDEEGNFVDYQVAFDSSAVFSLPRGNYYIVFDSVFYSYFSNVYGSGTCLTNPCDLQDAELLFFDTDASYTINMNIDRKPRIHGEFSDINDGELSNASHYFVFYQNNEEVLRKRVNYNSNSGEFSFYAPLTGPTKIAVEKSGYYRHFYDNINCLGDGCGLNSSEAVQMDVNQEVELNFGLKPIANINGQITNSEGEALSYLRVSLLNEYGAEIKSSWSDYNGFYEFIGLEVGSYYVLVTGSGGYESTFNGNIPCGIECNHQNAEPINLNADSFETVDISLLRKGVVSINEVKFMNGQFAANAKVKMIRIDNGQVTSKSVSQFGSINPFYLSPGEYVLTGAPKDSADLTTFYQGVLCDQEWSPSCVNQATILNVEYGLNIDINDFEIFSNGSIEVKITSDVSGGSIRNQRLKIYNEDFELVGIDESDDDGIAQVNNLPHGKYYIYTEYEGYGIGSYLPELYNEISCPLGLGISCQLADGDLVTVHTNETVSIDMGLQNKPKLTVNVKDSFTQELLDSARVRVFNQSGQNVTSRIIAGTHEFNLEPDTYFVTASKSPNFNKKGFPDVLCSYDMVCDSPLEPVVYDIVSGDVEINISLDFVGGIQGLVLDGISNEPVEGVVIDSWRVDNGSYYINPPVLSDANGVFRTYLDQGQQYVIGTDIPNSMNYMNQIYDRVHCPEGPAVDGMCDLSMGDQVNVSDSNELAEIVVFDLLEDDIFQSSFE